MSSPSMRTSSPGATLWPSVAGAPFRVTRPASIHLSASRREQTPVSLMYLLRRTATAHPPQLSRKALICLASAWASASNGSGGGLGQLGDPRVRQHARVPVRLVRDLS